MNIFGYNKKQAGWEKIWCAFVLGWWVDMMTGVAKFAKYSVECIIDKCGLYV